MIRASYTHGNEESISRYNEEALKMWLLSYTGYAGSWKPKDTPQPTGKRGSSMPTSAMMIDLMLDPHVRETHDKLYSIIFKEMRSLEGYDTLLFRVISRVYLDSTASGTEAEEWRRSRSSLHKSLLSVHDEAISFILERVGKEPLAMPDEAIAGQLVSASEYNRRLARRVFYRVALETLNEAHAKRESSRISGFSVRHVNSLVEPYYLAGFSLVECFYEESGEVRRLIQNVAFHQKDESHVYTVPEPRTSYEAAEAEAKAAASILGKKNAARNHALARSCAD